MQGNLNDPRFKLLKAESEEFSANVKDKVSKLPYIRVFDQHDELTAAIKLRPHIDEASYRDALMEVAIVLPSLNAHSCSLTFKTNPEGYGITVITPVVACSIFFSEDGEKIITEDTVQDQPNIDSETVMVLDKFIGKVPNDASFVHENLAVLGRHGHEIELFQDPDTFYKGIVF